MWNDEGLSVYRSRQTVNTIMDNVITIDGVETRDTNPPLYFLALAGWRRLVGESIFALRSLGILVALLNVPLVFQVARLAGGRHVGLVAAFLLAISPFHVWQSQELRNYSFLLFFNLASTYGLFQFLLAPKASNRGRWLLAWAVAGVAGIYTHYLGAFVLVFGVLAILISMGKKSGWRPSPRLIIAMGAGFLMLVPVVVAGLGRFRAGTQIDFVFVPPQHLLSHAASAYTVGIVHGFVQPLWRVLPGVLLVFVGIVALWSHRRVRALLLLIGYLFIPLVLLEGLSTINPIYNGPRHLYTGLPPFLILLSSGLVLGAQNGLRPKTWRPTGLLVLGLGLWLVASQLAWLNTQYRSEALVKDDIRGLAEYLGRVARADDLIVLHDTIIGLTFDYYYHGQARWLAVPELGEMDPVATIERLEMVSSDAQRVWFVSQPEPRTGFPRQVVSEWIRERWPRLGAKTFSSMWLQLGVELYAPQPVIGNMPEGATDIAADWNGELTLHGVEMPPMLRSGAEWQPIFYWSRSTQSAGSYSVSLRLADESGAVWQQSDFQLWSDYSPAVWPAGRIIRYQPVIDVPAGVPPGEYQVWMRLSHSNGASPLLTDGAADLLLARGIGVESARAPEGLQRLPEHQPIKERFEGEIELVGYDMPEGEYRPGHVLPLRLYWLALEPVHSDYLLKVELRDEAGQVVAEQVTSPSRGSYPTSRWQEGELLLGQAAPIIPASAGDGMLELSLALIHADTGQPLAANRLLGSKSRVLANLAVAPWPMVTRLPEISRSLTAEFGQPALAKLAGYDLSGEALRSGETLRLTLYWRSATGDWPSTYTVFVHLVGDGEEIVGQGDSVPVNGFRPTTSWRFDEVIVDPHEILVPEPAASGSFRLWVGMFDPETNERLPVTSEGATQPMDRLLLTEVSVIP